MENETKQKIFEEVMKEGEYYTDKETALPNRGARLDAKEQRLVKLAIDKAYKVKHLPNGGCCLGSDCPNVAKAIEDTRIKTIDELDDVITGTTLMVVRDSETKEWDDGYAGGLADMKNEIILQISKFKDKRLNHDNKQ